jgi:hypothetical protein
LLIVECGKYVTFYMGFDIFGMKKMPNYIEHNVVIVNGDRYLRWNLTIIKHRESVPSFKM